MEIGESGVIGLGVPNHVGMVKRREVGNVIIQFQEMEVKAVLEQKWMSIVVMNKIVHFVQMVGLSIQETKSVIFLTKVIRLGQML